MRFVKLDALIREVTLRGEMTRLVGRDRRIVDATDQAARRPFDGSRLRYTLKTVEIGGRTTPYALYGPSDA